ncbi:MAG: hypothetical protein ACOVQG_00750 [Crocinitomicaceae bacterium]
MKKIDFSIVIFNDDVNKLQFFTAIDIIMLIIWLSICLIICLYIKNLNKEKEHYAFFMRNFYFKVIFSIIFAFYYIFFIGGGDTIAFWDSSLRLTNLFYFNPEFYFQEWGQFYGTQGYISHFNSKTGLPPGWIAREAEGYYTSKLISIINPLTFGSYMANTVIFAFITSLASFKLYDFIVSFGIHDYRKLATYFLFIPSLAFWCTGLSKDTVITICLYYAIPLIYAILFGKKKLRIFPILYILLILIILNNVRSFMVVALLGPFFFAFNVRLLNKYFTNKFAKRFVNLIIFGIGFGIMSFYLGGESAQKYLTEAEITQKDFQNNPVYTGKKYDLGNVEFTTSGILKTMPLAVFTGIYRPFPWEALSPGLILNAFESLLLFYLTFIFLFNNRGKRVERIQNTEILMYAVFFVFVMAFMTGFTAVIFGVLVRLRAPLLPFFFMLLTVQPVEEQSTSESEEIENEEETSSDELSPSYS